MWPLIIEGFTTIFGGWVKTKVAKQEAEAQRALAIVNREFDYDIMAMEAAKTSWKDELITIIWFSPLYIGWFDWSGEGVALIPAIEWVTFVDLLPYWWWVGAFGIIASSFGLRWYFKNVDIKTIKAGTNK